MLACLAGGRWERLAELIPGIFAVGQPPEYLALGAIGLRAVVLYAFGLVLVRLGKSRMMSNATPLDVVVLIVLGSLLSRGINGSASLASTMVAATVLVGCHWLLTWATARSHTIGKIVKGHVGLLVVDGRVDEQAMRHSHISHEDLQEGMRLNGNIEDLALAERIYKERSGQISVVRRFPPPGTK